MLWQNQLLFRKTITLQDWEIQINSVSLILITALWKSVWAIVLCQKYSLVPSLAKFSIRFFLLFLIVNMLFCTVLGKFEVLLGSLFVQSFNCYKQIGSTWTYEDKHQPLFNHLFLLLHNAEIWIRLPLAMKRRHL